MIIPATFKLFGQTITVEHRSTMLTDDDALGQACYRLNKLYLTPSGTTFPIPREREERAFTHELVHFILNLMGSDLYTNEEFVDRFALLLHQYMTTQQGELK